MPKRCERQLAKNLILWQVIAGSFNYFCGWLSPSFLVAAPLNTFNMKKLSAVLLAFCLCFTLGVCAQKQVDAWLTDPASNTLFKKQAAISLKSKPSGTGPLITINADSMFQEIDGFGFALTGGSAQHIVKMTPASRAALLNELVRTDANNIGTSYLRLSIGASDLNATVFSYNALPAGETDTAMLRFDLGPDKEDVIPVMKEILKINPAIKIMGSP